jgi:hypothetical protein
LLSWKESFINPRREGLMTSMDGPSLREIIEDVKKRVESSDPVDVIKGAVDVLLLTDRKGEVHGFSLLLTYGGPNITFNYIRGDAYIEARWGNEQERIDVDPKIAEKYIDALETEYHE